MIDNLKNAINPAREVAENWKSELVNCVSEEGRNKCLERATEHEQLATYLEQLLAIQLLYKEYEGSGGGFHYQVGRVFDGDYVLDNEDSEDK